MLSREHIFTMGGEFDRDGWKQGGGGGPPDALTEENKRKQTPSRKKMKTD